MHARPQSRSHKRAPMRHARTAHECTRSVQLQSHTGALHVFTTTCTHSQARTHAPRTPRAHTAHTTRARAPARTAPTTHTSLTRMHAQAACTRDCAHTRTRCTHLRPQPRTHQRAHMRQDTQQNKKWAETSQSKSTQVPVRGSERQRRGE